MNTCAWCKTTNKTLTVDKEGVCPACRKAAQYPPHTTTKHCGMDEDGNIVRYAGRRTYPLGEDYRQDSD